MSKKILISLAIIAAVGAIVVGATTAYFSDTETSTGNTFTAGTIDISVDDQNPWTNTFAMEDMKPCYTDYINFKIENDISDPNPVDIWKKLTVTSEVTGAVSEPECEAENGTWNQETQTCSGNTEINDLSHIIWYDLNVEVYNGSGQKIWWQTIYVDGDKKSIHDIYDGKDVYLGMIPAGGYMLVEQSYHMKPTAGNEYQGDIMTFNIEIKAEQLKGIAWLENKDESQGWKIVHGDGIKGTLTYEVKNPTFDFDFIGRAPLANHNYVLAAGYNANTDVDTYLGESTTDANRDITITGDIDTGDMKDVKVWLVPKENWNMGTSTVNWSGWPTCADNFLWETGLIWYEDTN